VGSAFESLVEATGVEATELGWVRAFDRSVPRPDLVEMFCNAGRYINRNQMIKIYRRINTGRVLIVELRDK
jgi:hypothetical protein